MFTTIRAGEIGRAVAAPFGIEMGLLKEPPPDDVMFTTAFVPVK